MAKLFGSELHQHLADTAMDILNMYRQPDDPKWLEFQQETMDFYMIGQFQTVWAGTSEILRNIIAIRGLGLPR